MNTFLLYETLSSLIKLYDEIDGLSLEPTNQKLLRKSWDKINGDIDTMRKSVARLKQQLKDET